VTSRGAKHLNELAAQAARGDRAVQLFVVQRDDCQTLRPAADLDPVYAATIKQARAAGVEVLAYACAVSPEEISISHRMDFETL